MNPHSQGERDSLLKDESELVELEHDEATIEAEDHDGFVDAARSTRFKSEIEERETDIFHKKVQIEDEGP